MTWHDISLRYLSALALTLAVEVPCVLVLLRDSPRRKVLASALAANLLSHPALHFLLPAVVPIHPIGRFILVAELGAFAFEAAVYLAWVRPAPWPLAIAASAAANAASFGLGLVVWPPWS